jgi:hypothetical protein
MKSLQFELQCHGPAFNSFMLTHLGFPNRTSAQDA